MKTYLFVLITALSFTLFANLAFADKTEVTTSDNFNFEVKETKNIPAVAAREEVKVKEWDFDKMVAYIDQMQDSIDRIDVEVADFVAKMQSEKDKIVVRMTKHNDQLYQAEQQGVKSKVKDAEEVE